MSQTPSDRLGIAICESIGIDTDDVTGLTLEINVGEVAQLTIRRIVFDNEAASLQESITGNITTYRLEPREDST